MQAVLFVSHGSRLEIGVKEVVHFIKRYTAPRDIFHEICFIELAKPSIEEGIANCAVRGATQIIVVPILLLAAAHAKEDIQLEIQDGNRKYTQITFKIGRLYDVHPIIVVVIFI